MPLTDFFRINLPYGIKKNQEGEWFAFNREYLPIGWNSESRQQSIYANDAYNDVPIYTKYARVTEKQLLQIAHGDGGVKRTDGGDINMVFLYNDRSNPVISPEFWDEYFKRIKLLSKLSVKKVQQL